MLTSIITDAIREQKWSAERVRDLALAFIARKGLTKAFEGYIVRAAAKERERSAQLAELAKQDDCGAGSAAFCKRHPGVCSACRLASETARARKS